MGPYSSTSSYRSNFQFPSKRKKEKKTKPKMEFRFCLILSLCLMANGLPKKTKRGAKLRALDNSDTKMERLDSMEVKQKRMKAESGTSGAFPVRLIKDGVVGGKSGRLEVFIGGVWGTVCDDYTTLDDGGQPDDNVAFVVCRMLGLSGGRTINYSYNEFGNFDADPISVENLHCNGNEADISQCRMTWFGTDHTEPNTLNDCSHNE